MFNATLQIDGKTYKTSSETLEDIKVWVKIMSPQLVSNSDFDKVSKGNKLYKSIEIEMLREEPLILPPDKVEADE